MDISKEDILDLTSNIIRILTIFVVFNALSFIIDGDQSIFDDSSLKRLLYFILGVIAYSLVTGKIYKKTVHKEPSTSKKTEKTSQIKQPSIPKKTT